jgi:hypothetical protein
MKAQSETSHITAGSVPQMMASVQCDVGVGLPCNRHSKSQRMQRPSKKVSVPIGKLQAHLMTSFVILRNKIRNL